jgi:hypothetical protein
VPYKDKKKANKQRRDWALANPEKVLNWRVKNKDSLREYWKEYHLRNREKRRDQQRLWAFGLTKERYEQMLREQDGRCAICGDVSRFRSEKLVVDHCHASGGVRGLLCGHCNVAIGHMGENPDRLVSAAEYLHRHAALKLKALLE